MKETNPRVFILARKILKNNTRIFKQANSLTNAGYKVYIIGIKPKDLPHLEKKDGYTIIRLKLYPLYYSIPHYIKRFFPSFGRSTLNFFRKMVLIISSPLGILKTIGLKFIKVFTEKSSYAKDKKLLTKEQPNNEVRFFTSITPLLQDNAKKIKNYLFNLKVVFKDLLPYPVLHTLKFIFKNIRKFKNKNILGKNIKFFVLNVFSYIRVSIKTVLYYVINIIEFHINKSIKILKRIFNKHFRKIINKVKFILKKFLRTLGVYFSKKAQQLLLIFRWPLVSVDYYYRVYKYTKHNLKPPDIVHANDLDTLFIAYILSRKYNAKLIYDAQELYTGLHTLPKWYCKLLYLQEFFLIRKADKVTVVNDAIADKMKKMYRTNIDAVILNCPPYTNNFDGNEGRTIRDIFNLPDSIPVFLYSGGLVKQRGIENTIISLKYIKNGVLVILGEGLLKDTLIELIEKEGLKGRVFFTDFVPHTEVPKFISSADVGIIPYENVGINHYLCSPSKLFHYIMAELPVACSDFPFLRKIVLENNLGAVFDPGDPQSIASAIERIVADPVFYRKLKDNLKVAKRQYCWEIEEKKFLSIYNDVRNKEGDNHEFQHTMDYRN